MKTTFSIIFSLIATQIWAQVNVPSMVQYIRPDIQFFRPYDQSGINVFETNKIDTLPYQGLKVRIGAGFSQDYQALSQSNKAVAVYAPVDPTNPTGLMNNSNQLTKLTNNFNLAMANLYLDAQLYDGIRVNVTMYLSTRHHQETWVKNGYIQVDKLSFLKSAFIDSIMKSVTIRVGDLEVDFGDQHFRRSDGGNTIYNPFIENYIMDEFATEIGGEVYWHHKSGLMAMVGATNGQLDPTVVASKTIDSSTKKLNTYQPAFHGKIGFDKQVTEDFRIRLTGSGYIEQSTSSNTLYFGDRAGSHYFYAIENTQATADGNGFSGRYNPMFNQQVNAFMVNTLLKYKGLEFFGTYEMAQGRTITEKSMRHATQYAGDLIYRFPVKKQNFWIGARYNSVTAKNPTNPDNITISRVAGSIGWFVTKNIMMKAEYVNQNYMNFKSTDIRSGAQFSGVMVQAAVSF